MNYDLADLETSINEIYTDEYYTPIDLKRDIILKRINLAKYIPSYKNSNLGGTNTNIIPSELTAKLSPIVKESQLRKFIQLTIAQNLSRDFSKHLSARYRRKFKEREAYLLAQALAPAIAKNFYPQSFFGSKQEYVFGIEGLQRELKIRGKIYTAAIDRQLETLYSKGYMYALDENLSPIKVNGRVQILKDHKGVDIQCPPMDDGSFKFHHLWEFILDDQAHRRRKKSKVFSIPSSWKRIGEWERYLVATRAGYKGSERSQWSARIAKERNPLLRNIVEENTHSYFGIINNLANTKNVARLRGSTSTTVTGLRRVSRYIYPERKNIHSKFKSGFLWEQLSESFSGEKTFSENFESAFKKKLEAVEGNPTTGRITGRQMLQNKLHNSRLSRRLRGADTIKATKRPPKKKRRRVLKFLDFLALVPGLVIYALRYLVDRAIFDAIKYVADRQEITYSLFRNISGEGLAGRVLTSLDGLRFSFGIVKLIAKDGVEALIPGLLAGLTLSSPLAGVIFGSVFFGSKFFLDFTKYFSAQNPMVSNIVERIASTMTDRTLSLPEILFKSGTFGITTGIIGTVVAALFGISGLPLVFTGVGIFGAVSVLKAVDLSFVGRVLGDYSVAAETGSSFLIKSEYFIEIGGAGGVVGILGFLFSGNPLFLGLTGVGLISGSVADFFKASLFEDSVLHDISGVSAYDIAHTGVGFAGGGALIGFAIGGPIGAVIGGIALGGTSSVVSYIGKRGSRFIVHPDVRWENIDLSPERLNNLRFLSKDTLYSELAKDGYTPSMLDKVYGERGLFEYLHEPRFSRLQNYDSGYISDQLRIIREETLLERQEFLRSFNLNTASDLFKDRLSEALSRTNLNLEDFLKTFEGDGKLIDIEKLVANTDIQGLFRDYLANNERLDDLLKTIYRENFKNLANFEESEMKAFEKSSLVRDNSRFGLKYVSKEMNSFYKMSDILKNPTMDKFIDPEVFRIKLLDFFSVDLYKEDAEMYRLLERGSVGDFLRSRGLDISTMRYDEFIAKFSVDPVFQGFNLGEVFRGSDFFRFLVNTNLNVGAIFPNIEGLSALEESSTLRELLINSDRFVQIFNPEFIVRNLQGIELRELISDALDRAGVGGLGKIFAMSQVRVFETLRLTTEDLSASLTSGMMGGAILSVIFGITNPVAFALVVSGVIGGKTLLTILSKVNSGPGLLEGSEAREAIAKTSSFLSSAISKGSIAKISDFISGGFTPGVLGFLIGSYFLGPIGGILLGGGMGIGFGLYRAIEDASLATKLTGGFVEFVGKRILDPAFLVYMDTELVSPKFWEGLFFEHGITGFLPSLITVITGVISTFALAEALTTLGVFVGGAVITAIPALGFLAAIPAVAIGFGVVAGVSIGLNWLSTEIFGHGIFYYIGDFLKKAIDTVVGWFSGPLALASIGFDILIGIIALFFKGEFDIDDFLRTIFIMVLGWALVASLIGGGVSSGGNNNNTSNTINKTKTATPASSFLTTSGKIVNIENSPGSVTADTIFVKTSNGIIKINTNNPYLYKGESLYKGEYLGQ